jgi:hypothetical protein
MSRMAGLVFAAAVVAQWVVPLAAIWRHEQVLSRGVTVRVPCVAPDPLDMLRGRYLAVRPEQTEIPSPEGLRIGARSPVWATLEPGDDGLARIARVSVVPVAGPQVIRLTAVSTGSGTAMIEWPFDRLYLREPLGPAADAVAIERAAAGQHPVAEVRLHEGRAVLVDVTYGGRSIRAIAADRADGGGAPAE